jgi:predicted amidohydrolase
LEESVTRIGVASVPFPGSLEQAPRAAVTAIEVAAELGAQILCLPEACLPGHRLGPVSVPAYSQDELDDATAEVRDAVARAGVVTILGTERVTSGGTHLVATVFDATGDILGHQVKTQIAPEEEMDYVPGTGRHVFEAAGLTFGISICHEAFRHPETVRSAVTAGAAVVFHPHFAATDDGIPLTRWADAANPYYEKAVLCRAVENTVYMASANYALPDQGAATCVVGPRGELLGRLDYGRTGVLVIDIDPGLATGEMAKRYSPERNRTDVRPVTRGRAATP